MLLLINKVKLLLAAGAVAVYSTGWHLREHFTTDLEKVDWPRTALLVLLILAAASSLWQFAMPSFRTITQTEFRRVPEIRKVHDIERVRVACPESGIVVLDKAAVSDQLHLDFIQGGDIAAARKAEAAGTASAPKATPAPDLQVTATADIPESDNGVDVISIMDLQTGESHLEAREKSAPWFQFRNNAAVGIRYGVNQALAPAGTLYGRWDFLRVRNVYFSANGEITTGSDARIQLGAEYRW